MKDTDLKYITNGILNSYSQIFFSSKRVFAVILVLVTFFDWFAGACGLVSVILSNGLAFWLGFDRNKISGGMYGFNSLLTGLGIGIYYSPGMPVMLILLAAVILTVFITNLLDGIIGKYYLPFLSLPFLISLWTVTIATRYFAAMEISTRGLYKLNELYETGGTSLVTLYQWWTNLEVFAPIKVYFISLGAIFFQYNMLAGVVISLGILYYSRIAFSLSLIGFFAAYYFYKIIGADISQMSYNYIGFNYILTSIAIGGFFIIPSRLSYLWTILVVPIVAMISISASVILSPYQLSIFSLPFNIIVILFIYVIKKRLYPSTLLSEPYYQQGSPEINLYSFHNTSERFKNSFYFPVMLPFWGEWQVTQGQDGEHTHKDEWRHAWDFEILDNDNHSFKGIGLEIEDYYCYDKLVLAPLGGYVTHIVDGIPDNKINDVNTTDNWGNTIIIKHAEFLYTKLCHLKTGSFKVYIGEYVRQGQIIAQCGNSGRSPVPHLHFQIQATPYIGSKTLDYPICSYISRINDTFELNSFKKPLIKQIISNIEVNPLLAKAFHFIPGQKISWKVDTDDEQKFITWEIYTDIYNNSYFYCNETNSYAYFVNDGIVFYLKHFSGDKSSLLYSFFLAFYKVELGYYKNLQITDIYPIHLLVHKAGLFLQDFIAPFYIFIKAKYTLNYISVDNDLSPSAINLEAKAETHLFRKKVKEVKFVIRITEKGISKITITTKNKSTEALNTTNLQITTSDKPV